MKINNLQIDSLFFTTGQKNNRRNLFLLISLVFHLLFIIILSFITKNSSDKVFISDVISVDLISISAVRNQKNETAIKKNSSRAISKKKIKAKNVVSVSSKKTRKNNTGSKISLKKMKMKHSLKKKTYNSSKIVKTAIKDIEKNISNKNKESILNAISSIKKKVNKQEAGSKYLFSGNTTFSGNAKVNSFMKRKIDIYKAELKYKIFQNWVFIKQMAGGRDDLIVKIGIRINKKGTIEKMWFDQKSGNNYFDNTCDKAVKKTESAIPALPEGYHVQDFQITFTPLDIIN